MTNRNLRRLLPVILLLGEGLSLAATAGCGDDTVRGAGSIDVPKPTGFVMPSKSAARPGKTAGLPPRAR